MGPYLLEGLQAIRVEFLLVKQRQILHVKARQGVPLVLNHWLHCPDQLTLRRLKSIQHCRYERQLAVLLTLAVIVLANPSFLLHPLLVVHWKFL